MYTIYCKKSLRIFVDKNYLNSTFWILQWHKICLSGYIFHKYCRFWRSSNFNQNECPTLIDHLYVLWRGNYPILARFMNLKFVPQNSKSIDRKIRNLIAKITTICHRASIKIFLKQRRSIRSYKNTPWFAGIRWWSASRSASRKARRWGRNGTLTFKLPREKFIEPAVQADALKTSWRGCSDAFARSRATRWKSALSERVGEVLLKKTRRAL